MCNRQETACHLPCLAAKIRSEMTPIQFINKFGKGRAAEVAKEAGSTYEWFYIIALGHRNASKKLARNLVRASGGLLDFDGLAFATEHRPQRDLRKVRPLAKKRNAA